MSVKPTQGTSTTSGTVGAPQGWLYPAMQGYGLAGSEAQAVSDLLFNRLRALLLALDQDSGQPEALPQVHVFDSAGLPDIAPASADDTGASGDWVNEIHLTPDGYGKLGRAFGPWVEGWLARYP